MLDLLIILGFGIAYRIRGGLLDDLLGVELPNTLNRSIWAAYVALVTISSISSEWYALHFVMAFLLALAGAIPGYFGGKFDLTKQENRTWQNYAWLSARGMFLLFPLALCYSPLYPQLWLGVAAGALMPHCYLLGCLIPEKKGVISHSQWGELLIGLTLGAAIWIS